MLSIIKV